MKKKNTFYLLTTILTVAALFFTGCDSDGGDTPPPPPTGLDITVDAGIAPVVSRAAWDAEAAKMSWEASDAIGLFVGDNTNVKLTLGQDGKFAGKLTAEPASTADYYGYYPYSGSATLNGKTMTVALPATQQYKQDGFAAAPMVAAYNGGIDGAAMTFQHAFSVLKVSAIMKSGLAEAGVTSLRIAGNNSETLAGTAAIDLSGVSNSMDAATTIPVTFTDAATVLTLNCAAAVAVTDAGRTDFYVTIPAGEYSGGFTFTFTTAAGNIAVAYDEALTAQRGSIATVEVTLTEAKEPKYNIPDPTFRKFLADKQYILLDDDGEVETVFNPKDLTMRIYGDQYPDIKTFKGIEYFTECVYIDYDSKASLLEELDVTALTKLKHLQVTDQKKLTSINVLNNVELEELWLIGCGLTELELGELPKLTMLTIGGNPLSSIDVSKLPKVEVINIVGCTNISSLNVKNNPTLISLTVGGTKISSLDLSANSKIVLLDLKDTAIADLDVSHMTKLYTLTVARTKIKRVDVSNKSELVELLMDRMPELEYLDISGCNVLGNVAMTGKDGKIWSIMQASGTAIDFSLADFSYYPKLKTLIMDNMKTNQVITDFICKDSTLETISLQNSTGLSKLVVSDNPQLSKLYVNGLNMAGMDVTVSNNKTDNIIITTPRE